LQELHIIRVNDKNEWKCPFKKYLKDDTKQKLTSQLKIDAGDFVILASGVQFNLVSILSYQIRDDFFQLFS
jgi:aspartyl-tRNA synthetase